MIFKIFKKDLKGLSRNILALAIALGLALFHRFTHGLTYIPTGILTQTLRLSRLLLFLKMKATLNLMIPLSIWENRLLNSFIQIIN